MMQTSSDIQITAFWDEEAGVWVAESDHVPGLITEADTVEALLTKLQTLIPELLELNGQAVPQHELPVNLVVQRVLTPQSGVNARLHTAAQEALARVGLHLLPSG